MTGCLAAALATEPSELFREVALGQQASAPWQWLPGSTRPDLAAPLAKAGASQSFEDEQQDVTEKGRVTRGSCSGNPTFSFAEHMGNRAGNSAEPWLSLSDQVTSPGWTVGCWDQCRTCLGDGAVRRAKSQPGGALEHGKHQPTSWRLRASCTRRLPAGEDAVMGKGSHLNCFMMTQP